MLRRFYSMILIAAYLLWTLVTLFLAVYSYYILSTNIQFYYDAEEIQVLVILANLIVWIIFSLIALLNVFIYYVSGKTTNPFGNFLYTVFLYLILPFYLLFRLAENIRNLLIPTKTAQDELGTRESIKKPIFPLIRIIAILLIMVPIWYLSLSWTVQEYPKIKSYTIGLFKSQFNLVKDEIKLTGTGSMYPTFPKGEGDTPQEQNKEIVAIPKMYRYPSGFDLYGKKFFFYDIGRGDIVSFYNEKTEEIHEETFGTDHNSSGFTKRILALPGDKIEIRSGLFYLNGKPQKEPYAYKPRSTFGGDFLPECTTLTVPDEMLFVMGDNRKGSSDSRHELGLISYEDIDHYIPFTEQIGIYDKNWRDTTSDFDESSKIRLNKQEYLSMVNQKRLEKGAPALEYEPKLERSAYLRGEVMLKYNDFSYEAEKSGYDMKNAMNDAGYSNIVTGEWETQGYYEAGELLDIQFEFPDLQEFLLNPEYQDIGLAEVEGDLNGCPSQVIVYHLAGYLPPNYDSEIVNSWRALLDNLKDIKPSWEELKDFENYYSENKKDVDRINEIISYRINNLERIVSKMENNEWLSPEDEDYIENDAGYGKEQGELADRLNSR